jgi:hypothetical protein
MRIGLPIAAAAFRSISVPLKFFIKGFPAPTAPLDTNTTLLV